MEVRVHVLVVIQEALQLSKGLIAIDSSILLVSHSPLVVQLLVSEMVLEPVPAPFNLVMGNTTTETRTVLTHLVVRVGDVVHHLALGLEVEDVEGQVVAVLLLELVGPQLQLLLQGFSVLVFREQADEGARGLCVRAWCWIHLQTGSCLVAKERVVIFFIGDELLG